MTHGLGHNQVMELKPINLQDALATFDEVYSPRIVTRMNDYDVRIAHALGEHVWHVHEDTDEFFLVLDGQFDVAVRDADGARDDGGADDRRHVRRTERGPSTSHRRPAARS